MGKRNCHATILAVWYPVLKIDPLSASTENNRGQCDDWKGHFQSNNFTSIWGKSLSVKKKTKKKKRLWGKTLLALKCHRRSLAAVSRTDFVT